MPQFEDDDFADYDNMSAGEEFNEDDLNDEEYNKLYDSLPKLKQQISSYNDSIDDLAMKEALYFNYYDLNNAMDELKSRFKKKEELQEAKPLSKLQKLAQSRAKSKSTNEESSGENQSNSGESKLATLAKLRAQGGQSNNLAAKESNRSLGILEKLKSKSSSFEASEKKLLHRDPARQKLSLPHKATTSPAKRSRSKPNPELQPSSAIPSNRKKRTAPQLIYDLPSELEKVLDTPQSSISLFFNDKERESKVGTCLTENRNKRIKFASSIFCPLTNIDLNIETFKNAQKNFAEPSPDDKVLNAHKKAFEEEMGDLKISEQSKNDEQPKDKVPPKSTKPYKKIDLTKELSTNKAYLKPHKSFVVIGHVDAGKSTLMGRLLYDLGVVDAKTVNKLVREAEKSGKGSFALAWVMDQTTEERSRGVTVDICATEFETNETVFTAIDAPGHKDFVPQMIGGVTQADIALLIVDSINGEFEAGFNMDGQTKEHTLLCKNLGIEKICVAVNKLDKEGWSESRFSDIQNQLMTFLTSAEVGFSHENITFVPISGLTGNNVVKVNDPKGLEWYSGPTLLSYLEKVEVKKTQSSDLVSQVSGEEFTLAINDVYDVSNSEFAVKGRILSGFIQPGETIEVSPTKEFLQIQSLKIRDHSVDVGVKGENATLFFKTGHLTNKSTDDISVGDLISRINSSVSSVKSFTAKIRLFNMNKPLLVGTPFVLFRNNSYVPARISKILEIDDEKRKKKKMHLVSKQSALAEIEIQGDSLLPLSKFEDSTLLGRVVIRREGVTIGAGTVVSL